MFRPYFDFSLTILHYDLNENYINKSTNFEITKKRKQHTIPEKKNTKQETRITIAVFLVDFLFKNIFLYSMEKTKGIRKESGNKEEFGLFITTFLSHYFFLFIIFDIPLFICMYL